MRILKSFCFVMCHHIVLDFLILIYSNCCFLFATVSFEFSALLALQFQAITKSSTDQQNKCRIFYLIVLLCGILSNFVMCYACLTVETH